MALVNIDTAIKRAIAVLAKLSPPQGLEILTYKRNRGVVIFKLQSGQLDVRERGYHEARYTVDQEDLKKLLRPIAKREFPRSRKVRLYVLTGPEDLDHPKKKI